MENYQTGFQIGAAIFQILAIICAFGAHYSGEKAKSNSNKDDVKKEQIVIKDSPNVKISSSNKIKSPTIINATNALIVTNEQSGGTNIVNYNGGKYNPANTQNKPIFEKNGSYGVNILEESAVSFTKDTDYSFFAQIPVNQKLKVILTKNDSDKSALWGMNIGKIKNWVYTTYDNINGNQVYTLEEDRGDLNIIFWKSGSAKLDIYYNDVLVSSKVISWE